jgi:isoaspartyl peptidase/L-asparaginase-like protein (Ntn-hydrolase superfamily)
VLKGINSFKKLLNQVTMDRAGKVCCHKGIEFPAKHDKELMSENTAVASHGVQYKRSMFTNNAPTIVTFTQFMKQKN